MCITSWDTVNRIPTGVCFTSSNDLGNKRTKFEIIRFRGIGNKAGSCASRKCLACQPEALSLSVPGSAIY
jgi:hypothetical protein